MSYLGANPRITTQQFRPQSADPANPFEGMVFRSDGTSRGIGLWEYRSGSWQQLASGLGGLDTVFQLTGLESLSSWSNGNNASFLGGGALAGTFVFNTATPLNGTNSYQYTQAAGSLNDYIASPIQPVAERFRGQTCTLYFPFKYDGGLSDIEVVLYDVTNAAKLTIPASSLLPVSFTISSVYKVNLVIPATCTQLRFGFQVKVLNSTKILQFDDVVVSSDVSVYADPSTVTDWQSYTPTFTGFGTVSASSLRWRRVGDSVQVRGAFTIGTPTAVEARISLPNSYTSSSRISTLEVCGNFARNANTAASFYQLIEPSVGYATFGVDNNAGTAASLVKANATTFSTAGNILSVNFTVPVTALTASNPQIIAATDSFSTDSASLVYAGSSQYTPTTLADAPVGTFITFTYAASSNTKTQTNAAPPTQTTSSMNTNGIQIFSRTYSAASTAASPAAVSIQVGKNFKGVTYNMYKSLGKLISGSTDFAFLGSTDVLGMFTYYDETTGILILDAGDTYVSGISGRVLRFSDQTVQNNGYVVLNASKSPALAGVPQVLPRIAYLSDQKPSGTSGGTPTATVYNTRTLNTLVDSTGLVTSLSSNQFTLSAGTYSFHGTAPARKADPHKTRLRNITDSTTAIIGSSEYQSSGGDVQTLSTLRGEVTITAPKVFEFQHYFTTATAPNGLGVATSSGDIEVYAQLTIQKIK